MSELKKIINFICVIVLIITIPADCFANGEELMIVSARNVGMPSDIVRACIKESGKNYKIQKLPWARAYKLATTKKNVLIYLLNMTEDRKPLFHWVGPMTTLNQNLYRLRTRTDINVSTLEDAKKYTVGVIRGFANAKFLSDNGFRQINDGGQIDLVHAETNNIKKLFLGRIDLLTMSDESLPGNLRLSGLSERKAEIELVYTMRTQRGFMAFSQNTSQEYIDIFQSAFDKIRQNGILEQIREKYNAE